MSWHLQLLLLFALGLIWRMWRWIKASRTHLTDQELLDFVENRQSGQQLKHTREHLLHCEECKDRLDEIQRAGHRPQPDRWMKRRF